MYSVATVPRVIIIICESYRSRAQQTQPDYSSLLSRASVREVRLYGCGFGNVFEY